MRGNDIQATLVRVISVQLTAGLAIMLAPTTSPAHTFLKGGEREASSPWLVQPASLLPTASILGHPPQQLAQTVVAQTVDGGCRQANSATGIYTQPNLESTSRGILTSGQMLRVDLASSSAGWARVVAPVIGWVESRYLTSSSACSGFASSGLSSGIPSAAMPATTATPAATATFTPAPTAVTPSTPIPATAQATTAQATTSLPAATTIVSAVCEVLPTEGLVVRSEPTSVGNTALHLIPKGQHAFQFTNHHLTSHTGSQERQWVYITAPYQGWISLGVVGGAFNLGGRECG